VHHLRAAQLKPIMDIVQSGDLYRLRGHCGAPSTDFVEYVHIFIYERRFGRLTAHTFSYSGNPQGCDHVVRHLHTALENLQARLSQPPVMETPGAGAGSGPLGASRILPPAASTSPWSNPTRLPAVGPGRQPAVPGLAPGSGGPTGPVIPLTPAEAVR
jgi:hypothetical protein